MVWLDKRIARWLKLCDGIDSDSGTANCNFINSFMKGHESGETLGNEGDFTIDNSGTSVFIDGGAIGNDTMSFDLSGNYYEHEHTNTHNHGNFSSVTHNHGSHSQGSSKTSFGAESAGFESNLSVAQVGDRLYEVKKKKVIIFLSLRRIGRIRRNLYHKKPNELF